MKIRPRVDTTGGFDTIKNAGMHAKILHTKSTIEVGSLESGMESGLPSVMFCFTLPDGQVVLAETSLALFTAAAAALRAAHE